MGVRGDTQLPASGYSWDEGPQCYIWHSSRCSSQPTLPPCNIHTGTRLNLSLYENCDCKTGWNKDSYMSTVAPGESYKFKRLLGQIATDNQNCPEAVKLNFYVKTDTLLGAVTITIDHFATVDTIPVGYTPDLVNVNLYCVPKNATNKCGATVPLYRLFNLWYWDHTYATTPADVANCTARGYELECDGLPECYIWEVGAPNTCPTTPSATPPPCPCASATTTTTAMPCPCLQTNLPVTAAPTTTVGALVTTTSSVIVSTTSAAMTTSTEITTVSTTSAAITTSTEIATTSTTAAATTTSTETATTSTTAAATTTSTEMATTSTTSAATTTSIEMATTSTTAVATTTSTETATTSTSSIATTTSTEYVTLF
uniref:Uncharacterized protein n=1 Tax=Plectus sambesii TaxID=2011161 RepID=A0A914WEK3_9BILA